MRLPVLCSGILVLTGLAISQSKPIPELHLRGDRFKALTREDLTPEQKTMIEHLFAGERGGTNGPFNVLLRSPKVGDLAQAMGGELRFHSAIPKPLNEMAILMTGRFWDSQYEWSSHHKLALTAGLSPATIEAIANGKRPSPMQPDEEAVYNFSSELLKTHQVSDANFKAVVDKFGERGAVDLISVMGYYCLVSMALNVDRYPMPEGEKLELKPLHHN